MGGKAKVVMFPIALVYQIVMPLGRAMEESIRRYVLTVLTTQWVLRANSLVYMVRNTHQIALFANVIHVIPDWLVTLSALDKELADKVSVTVIQDGKVKPVKF